MKNSPSAAVIGAYKYDSEPLSAEQAEAFYRLFETFFAQRGIVPTYIGIGGKGFGTKLTRWMGRSHRRLLKQGFDGLDSIGLVANPIGSDAPAYDATACASVGHLSEMRETHGVIRVRESDAPLFSDAWDRVVLEFASMYPWDCGFGLSASEFSEPELLIVGADNRRATAEELQILNVWNNATNAQRISRLRSIYPYLLVNAIQAAFRLPGGQTLLDFLRREPGCTVRDLPGSSLQLVKVQFTEIARLRAQLRDSGALLA